VIPIAGKTRQIAGRQGSGRTMLIRALTGIWPFGAGRIEQPARDRIFFLSRQPHLPIGPLRGRLLSVRAGRLP
jgi:putative ATP-binding cassette transporter